MSTIPSSFQAMTDDQSRESWLTRMSRTAIHRMLSKIESGRLVLVEGDRRFEFGRAHGDTTLAATVTVHSPELYRRAAFGGHIAIARCYAEGIWSCDNLAALVRIFVRQIELMDSTDSGWARLIGPIHRAYHALRRNTKANSRRNISAHYDLGNDFFELFLDSTLTYSAGYFESPHAGMREASIAKLDRICRKLDLKQGDHILEIGTGWGSFAIHAARNYGCRVTTTTISREQHDLARRRIEAAGLADRVRVLQSDYRDVTGQYDRVVSIEMIEAVGHQYFDTFFRACAERLKSDGRMILQAITIPDRRYESARRTVDFIKRDIFPGCCIPSVERMCRSVSKLTEMRLTHLEDIGPHYARTLQAWRQRMHANLDSIRALGYTEYFIRQWEFYLCYCEGGFAERYLGCAQLVFDMPRFSGRPAAELLSGEITRQSQ